jgi:hypothetical protein
MFYLILGEFEFLDGDTSFVAGPGRPGLLPAHYPLSVQEHRPAHRQNAVLLTPGGSEGLFLEGGTTRSRASRCLHGGRNASKAPCCISLRSTGSRRCPNSDAACKSVG